MATSLEGYSSHCSLMERQKALVAAWDICKTAGHGPLEPGTIQKGC